MFNYCCCCLYYHYCHVYVMIMLCPSRSRDLSNGMIFIVTFVEEVGAALGKTQRYSAKKWKFLSHFRRKSGRLEKEEIQHILRIYSEKGNLRYSHRNDILRETQNIRRKKKFSMISGKLRIFRKRKHFVCLHRFQMKKEEGVHSSKTIL